MFLTNLVSNVLNGDGVPFYRQRRLDKLMEIESMRLIVVSAIRQEMASEFEDTEVHDVVSRLMRLLIRFLLQRKSNGERLGNPCR